MSGNLVAVYFAGAFLATTFEYIVGIGMIKLLGDLWWDYNEKPFNYKGIICLESTIAWGFYAVGIVAYLHGQVYRVIDMFSIEMGKRAIYIVLTIVVIDYMFQLAKVFEIDFDIRGKKDAIVEYYRSFKARWY